MIPTHKVVLDSKSGVMGVRWDKGSSPTLTRIGISANWTAKAGLGATPVYNRFDTAPIYRDIKEVTDSLGNVFIRIPKFYIRKTDATNYKSWEISLKPLVGGYLPWCFWDFTNNRELPYIDVGKYQAGISGDGTKLESKSGQYPLFGQNIVQFRDLATANGTGYQQLDIHVVDVLHTLAFIEFATVDIQAIMQGYTLGQYTATHLATVAETGVNRIIVANAHAALYRVGQAISIGTSRGGNQICFNRTITAIDTYDASNMAIVFDGAAANVAVGNMLYNSGWKSGACDDVVASSGILTANDGKYPCMYRGIENPFGNLWQFVDGVNTNNGQSWVCKNAAQYASNVFASPYEQLSYINSNANGYVTAMGHDVNLPFAELPTAVSGSDVGYKDYLYQNNVGQFIALVGGYWYYGSYAGLSCWNLNFSSSAAGLAFGGRLLKKPL